MVHGRDAIEAHVRETFSGFPDFTLQTHEMLVDGDTVARLDGDGDVRGRVLRRAPTGRTFTAEGMARTVVEDGLIRADRLYYDRKAMLDQLGVTFPDVLFLLPRMAGAKVRGLL